MAVPMQMVQRKNDSSVMRRLIGMAAPVVGGSLGGAPGAAAGAAIGNAIVGGSPQDGMMGALSSAMAYRKPKGEDPKPAPTTAGDIVGEGAGGAMKESAWSRRLGALSQDPRMALKEGLSVATMLPQGHPIRQELIPSLVQADMLAEGNSLYGMKRRGF